MKKSLFAAVAAAALMAVAATAAPIPSMELNGVASATKVVVINAPASTTLTNAVAVTDPPKNGSSDKVVGTGMQFKFSIVSRGTQLVALT